MEGSAIARGIAGSKRISNSSDPDMDGMQGQHIPEGKTVSNSDKASPHGLGRDSISLCEPKDGTSKIKGGQNV